MKTEIELIKVEAIELVEESRSIWNRFWWEGTINGKTYGLSQDANIDFITDGSCLVQYVQDLFDKKRKEING